MFTGIIRYTGEIINIESARGGERIRIKTDKNIISKLEAGITSVAIDGACHTVEMIDKESFSVYSSFETLKKTTVGNLTGGNTVNLELPLTPVTLMDGHLVQGHVDGVGTIAGIKAQGESFLYSFNAPASISVFLVEKDSIAIDGISLTLFNIRANSFQAAVIPETIKNTSLSRKKEGAPVNLEINLFAKYTYQFLKEKPGSRNEKIENFLLY